MTLKKTAALLITFGMLSGCESWNMPNEDEVFVVKDDVGGSAQWTVDGVNNITEKYLYNIDTKVYEIVARRTTNKLLDYTAPIYDTASRPTVFVGEAQKRRFLTRICRTVLLIAARLPKICLKMPKRFWL